MGDAEIAAQGRASSPIKATGFHDAGISSGVRFLGRSAFLRRKG